MPKKNMFSWILSSLVKGHVHGAKSNLAYFILIVLYSGLSYYEEKRRINKMNIFKEEFY